jgi:hypothetical protein
VKRFYHNRKKNQISRKPPLDLTGLPDIRERGVGAYGRQRDVHVEVTEIRPTDLNRDQVDELLTLLEQDGVVRVVNGVVRDVTNGGTP